jgi:non-ribosomal peptide synthase protein (TIGR01720 family)
MVDLSQTSDADQESVIHSHAENLQASLNLQQGPLMRVAFFKGGTHGKSYLLIVIHHLAVDGVSWRILFEDLRTTYEQLSRGEQISLPPKTTSFKSWAERLTVYASADAPRIELPDWLALAEKPVARLPLDRPDGINTVTSARTVSDSLSGEETLKLLQEVPAAYRTQINEVLLTALVRAFSLWTGSPTLLVDLEGHGREDIFEGVDLSRTVGWFTTIFPVVLDIRGSHKLGDALRMIKEQLREIPNRGIGYGLLRYASGDKSIGTTLRELPQAEVRFNYLGQLDKALSGSSLFALAPGPSGMSQSAKGMSPYLLDIVGSVVKSELRLDWSYSSSIHRRESVEQLARHCIEELRSLIAERGSRDAASLSPSDFPMARVSQADLNKVLSKIKQK